MKRWVFVWATALLVILLVGCQSRLKAYEESLTEAFPIDLYWISLSAQSQDPPGYACTDALALHKESREAIAAIEVPDDEIAIETQEAALEYLDAGIALYTECGNGTTDNTADLANHDTFLAAEEKYRTVRKKLNAAVE